MAADWTVIKAEYIADPKTSYRKLAEKYGVPRASLERKAKQENWAELRKKTDGRVMARTIEKIAIKKSDTTVKRVSITQDCANLGLDALHRYIAEHGFEFDGSEFRNVAAALKTFKEVKHDLTELELREQDARIRALEKQNEDKTNVDNKVEVSFVGLEDWFNGT